MVYFVVFLLYLLLLPFVLNKSLSYYLLYGHIFVFLAADVCTGATVLFRRQFKQRV